MKYVYKICLIQGVQRIILKHTDDDVGHLYDSIEYFKVYEKYLAYYLDNQDITYQEEQLINQLELGLTSLARVGVMDKQPW